MDPPNPGPNSQLPQPPSKDVPSNSLQQFYRVPLDDHGLKYAIIRRTSESDKGQIHLDIITSLINKTNGLDDPPRPYPNIEEIPLCPCCRSDSEPSSQNKLLRAALNHPQLYQSMSRLPKAVRIRPLTQKTTTTPPQIIHHPQPQQTAGDISHAILPPQPHDQQAAADFLARLNSTNGANTHHGQRLLAPQTPNTEFTVLPHIPPTGPHKWSLTTPADNTPLSPPRDQYMGLPNLCLGIEQLQFNRVFKSLDDPIPWIDRILEVNSYIEKNNLWREKFPPLNPALYLQDYNPETRQPTSLEILQEFQRLQIFNFHFETYRKRVAQKHTHLKGPFQQYPITPQEVFEPDFMPPLVGSEETSQQQSFQQHNLHKEALQHHAMRQQNIQEHPIQQHPTQQHALQQNAVQQNSIQHQAIHGNIIQKHSTQQHSIQQNNTQQHTIPSRPIPLQAYRPHVQQYGIQQRAIQKHAIRKNSIRKYAIRQHAFQQHDIRQHAIQQQVFQEGAQQTGPWEQGFQQQGFQQQLPQQQGSWGSPIQQKNLDLLLEGFQQPSSSHGQAMHHQGLQPQPLQQQALHQQIIQQASQQQGPLTPQHKHPIFRQPLSPPPRLLGLNPVQDPHASINDQNHHSRNELGTISGGSRLRKKKAGLSIIEARLAKQREGTRKSSRFGGARDDN